MNNMKQAFAILGLILLLLIGCNVTFGGGFENTPLGNYDFFFYELSKSYAYNNYTFENDLTLSQIKATERGNIDSSWKSLETALDRVINVHIRDPHIYSVSSPIQSPSLSEDTFFINERNTAVNGDGFDNFIPDGTSTEIDWIDKTSTFIWYGTIARDSKIAYIYINDLVDKIGGSSRLEDKTDLGALTDSILTQLHEKNADRIIVDIRSQAGGAVHRGKQIASRFLSSSKVFMISKYMSTSSTLLAEEETIAPDGVDYFRDAPLIVLINSNTCSGGEMTTLMFQQADGYKDTIGTSSRGCTGTIIHKELPNGWYFAITTSQTFTPESRDYFKVGLKPTIFAIRNEEIADNVLNRAITEIQNY